MGFLAVAAFLLAGVSVFLNVTSLAAIHRLPATMPSGAAAFASLRWSAIESADRATYISNLRAIGCPEATIDAIVNAPPPPSSGSAHAVSADIQAVPAIAAKAAQSPGFFRDAISTPGAIAQVANAGEAAATSVPAGLMSKSPPVVAAPAVASSRRFASTSLPPAIQPGGGRSATSTGTGAQSMAGRSSAAAQAGGIATAGEGAAEQVIVAPDDHVLIPAAFQPADPKTTLSDREKAQQDALQQQFADAVQQDPSSSEVWRTAQEKSDAQFRLLFGYQAFLQRQIQANLLAASTR